MTGWAPIVALLAAVAAAAPAAADEAEEILLANAEYALWHAAGHALAAEFALPVDGHEEDAADAFATLMMLSVDDAASIERLVDVAELWIVRAARDAGAGIGNGADHFARHDLGVQRGLRVICFIAGEGPGRAHELIARWGLPAERPGTCADEHEQVLERFEALLAPHLRPEGARPVRVRVTHADGPWHDWLVREELLETVAEAVGSLYAVLPGLSVAARACGEPDVFWEADTRTVTLCYELLAEYRTLAAEMTRQ